MPIRAYLVLSRKRLLWCAFIALVVPFAVVLLTASEDSPDFGVFWNHFCGCAPAHGDAFALLYASTLTALCIGAILATGNSSGNAYAVTQAVPGFRSGLPYVLTRPMRRSAALFGPAMIAAAAIVLLPALGFAVIFGWMRLVHAPALVFFPRALRLVPDAAALPPDASWLTVLAAAHAPACYLASISIGLLFFTLYFSQRWLMLSRHGWVRVVAVLQTTMLIIFPIVLRHVTWRLASWIFLLPKGTRLAWHPTASMLLVHYAVPAALMYWCWRTLLAADL